MKKATDFKRGDIVTYQLGPEKDKGIVTNVNETWVFVRFEGCTSQACNPNNLEVIGKVSID